MSEHVFGQADDCIRCLDCEALATTTKPCPVERKHTGESLDDLLFTILREAFSR